jgi:hypothetical protein
MFGLPAWLRWHSSGIHDDKEQKHGSVSDAREWRLNGVTNSASYLVSFSCGCECRLGKTL